MIYDDSQRPPDYTEEGVEQVAGLLAESRAKLDARKPEFDQQRIERGFSDMDAWNADGFISGIVAGVLRWYIEKGMGICGTYMKDGVPFEECVAARDADYERIADIFDRYHTGDSWESAEDVAKFGGVTEAELDEALAWLVKNFRSLWD